MEGRTRGNRESVTKQRMLFENEDDDDDDDDEKEHDSEAMMKKLSRSGAIKTMESSPAAPDAAVAEARERTDDFGKKSNGSEAFGSSLLGGDGVEGQMGGAMKSAEEDCGGGASVAVRMDGAVAKARVTKEAEGEDNATALPAYPPPLPADSRTGQNKECADDSVFSDSDGVATSEPGSGSSAGGGISNGGGGSDKRNKPPDKKNILPSSSKPLRRRSSRRSSRPPSTVGASPPQSRRQKRKYEEELAEAVRVSKAAAAAEAAARAWKAVNTGGTAEQESKEPGGGEAVKSTTVKRRRPSDSTDAPPKENGPVSDGKTETKKGWGASGGASPNDSDRGVSISAGTTGTKRGWKAAIVAKRPSVTEETPLDKGQGKGASKKKNVATSSFIGDEMDSLPDDEEEGQEKLGVAALMGDGTEPIEESEVNKVHEKMSVVVVGLDDTDGKNLQNAKDRTGSGKAQRTLQKKTSPSSASATGSSNEYDPKRNEKSCKDIVIGRVIKQDQQRRGKEDSFKGVLDDALDDDVGARYVPGEEVPDPVALSSSTDVCTKEAYAKKEVGVAKMTAKETTLRDFGGGQAQPDAKDAAQPNEKPGARGSSLADDAVGPSLQHQPPTESNGDVRCGGNAIREDNTVASTDVMSSSVSNKAEDKTSADDKVKVSAGPSSSVVTKKVKRNDCDAPLPSSSPLGSKHQSMEKKEEKSGRRNVTQTEASTVAAESEGHGKKTATTGRTVDASPNQSGTTNPRKAEVTPSKLPQKAKKSEKGGRAGISAKMKQCPHCSRVISVYGFAMHFRKCCKYKNWKCRHCGVTDVHSFSPDIPMDGPTGSKTLCPDCGKKWKEERESVGSDGVMEGTRLIAPSKRGGIYSMSMESTKRHSRLASGEAKAFDQLEYASTSLPGGGRQGVGIDEDVDDESRQGSTSGTAAAGSSAGRYFDTHSHRKRKPVKVFDPDDSPFRTREGKASVEEDEEAVQQRQQQQHPPSPHFTRRSKRAAALMDAAAAAAASCNEPVNKKPGGKVFQLTEAAIDEERGRRVRSKRASSRTRERSGSIRETIPDPLITEKLKERARQRAGKWSVNDECALLLMALNNPQLLVREGAGSWMLHTGQEHEEEETTASAAAVAAAAARSMSTHFDRMLTRLGNNGDRSVANTPPQNRATHVLSAAMAMNNPMAQHIALLNAGWQVVPPAVVDSALSTSLSSSRGGGSVGGNRRGGQERSGSRWHRPTVSDRVKSKLSLKDYVKSSLPLEKAWREHIEELRGGIEEALGPPPRPLAEPEEETAEEEEQGVSESSGDEEEESGAEEEEEDDGATEEDTNEKEGPVDESEVPSHVRTMIKKRKQFLVRGDPRPCLTCTWCGPKWKRNQRNISATTGKKKKNVESAAAMGGPPSCPGCRLLYDEGWRMHGSGDNTVVSSSSWSDYRYTDPSGKSLRSVKSFLMTTTRFVALAMGEGSEGDEHSPPQTIDEISGAQSSCQPQSRAGGVEEDTRSEITEESLPDLPILEREAPHPLPTIHDLYLQKEGLASVLKADTFMQWNGLYGSDANIALKILCPLAKGKLPYEAKFETPFLRSKEEIFTLCPNGGAPPTRFLGVVRMVKKETRFSEKHEGGDSSTNVSPSVVNVHTGKFGVEFPIFAVNYGIDGEGLQPTGKGGEELLIPLPKPATVEGGKPVLLRTDMDREDVAGQLYSYLFRLMYGHEAAESVRARTNHLHSRSRFVEDTLRAFGARRVAQVAHVADGDVADDERSVDLISVLHKH